MLGVRAVLGEPGTVDAAVATWAPTLWGIAEAERDARTGFYWTRSWFEQQAGAVLSGGWPPIDPADGWATILTELRDDLAHIDPNLTVRQVKQKYGVLDVRVEVSSPELESAVHDRIASAEQQSARTCERCGRPGRVQQRTDGWYQALCPQHAGPEGEQP